MPVEFSIDAKSPLPPFDQIKQSVISAISARVLLADEKLPPIRQLASQLGLAVNTVARSYRELEDEGFVITQGRSGTRVHAGAVPAQIALEQLTRAYVEKVSGLGVAPEEVAECVRRELGLA